MGKTIRNLIGILLLATAVAVTQIPVSDVEAVDTSSASDFQMDKTTLKKYTGTSEDVSISNYVQRIEAEAFAGNDHIRNVTIGDGVKVIATGAFAGCGNLESVTIPDSVTTIENAAFANCPSLSRVTVGTGLTELGTVHLPEIPVSAACILTVPTRNSPVTTARSITRTAGRLFIRSWQAERAATTRCRVRYRGSCHTLSGVIIIWKI